jgi:V/A-type H+-transporting ATPase subunit C
MASGGVSGYAAIHARVRVMYAGLLTPQLGARLSAAAGFDELAGLLRDTAYGSYLSGAEQRKLTPRALLYQIKRRVAAAYTTIIYSAPVSTRPLLIQLYRHFEIDNLKALLRGLVTGSTWEQVQDVLFPLGSLSALPAQAVMEAGSVESAIARLSHTPYYETLSHALKRYSDEQSLFPLEVALDLNYWGRLWAVANQLPGTDRAQARRMLGPLVDMTNFMWAVRYRVYYHLTEEEIINYTLPFGYRLHDEDIRAVAAGGAIAPIVERIFPGMKDIESLLEEPERGLPKLELQLLRSLRRHFHSVFSGYPFHIGLPLAFALLNELEIQDLSVWIEAKAAQIPPDVFSAYLLMDSTMDLGVAA